MYYGVNKYGVDTLFCAPWVTKWETSMYIFLKQRSCLTRIVENNIITNKPQTRKAN